MLFVLKGMRSSGSGKCNTAPHCYLEKQMDFSWHQWQKSICSNILWDENGLHQTLFIHAWCLDVHWLLCQPYAYCNNPTWLRPGRCVKGKVMNWRQEFWKRLPLFYRRNYRMQCPSFFLKKYTACDGDHLSDIFLTLSVPPWYQYHAASYASCPDVVLVPSQFSYPC
jgi:hypothetical protein